MMHPILSLVVWCFFLLLTVFRLKTGQAHYRWFVFTSVATREDHPIAYWMQVGAGLIVLVILPLYCLPDWIIVLRDPERALAAIVPRF